MNNHQEKVREFMQAFGQPAPARYSPHVYPVNLRASLIEEEAREFCEASKKGDYIEMIDAMCDLLYVTYGAAVALGIDLDPFFAEVHRSNMSKLDENGKPVYRADGKVTKPAHWSPPNLRAVLAAHVGLAFAQPDVNSAS